MDSQKISINVPMQPADIRPMEVHERLDELERQINFLTDTVATLETRLVPVLNRSNPVTTSDAPDRMSCNTAIGERIQHQADRVESARHLLESLTTQLEV